MFEAAELGRKVSSEDYKARVPALRQELLDGQTRLREAKRSPVIVLFSGVDGAGKSESVNLLNEWMDPRHIRTHAFPEPSDEERERPRMWRFWRALPPKGKIGILFGAWHSQPILDRVYGRTSKNELGRATAEITRFEKMLTDEGARQVGR